MSAGQARLGLAIGGFAIGSFFGVPGLGLAIGSIAGGLLFPGPDPPPALGPRLGDLQVQVSAYGNPIPKIYGTARAAGNIIWNSKIREIANKQKQSGGGKGGSPKQESITFTYEVDLQISLGEGPIDGIKRVWANDKVIYDYSNPPHARGLSSKIYFGTTTQMPDPTVEADKGVGNVSAHRGLANIVFTNLQLEQFQNGIPVFHFEVIANGDPTLPTIVVPDDPTGGGGGRVEIDVDTGLIWVSRPLTNQIDIFRCNNGLSRLCSITGQITPFHLSYQPSFTAVAVDILGTVTIAMVPPKMFCASSTPDGLGGVVQSYSTDGACRVIDTFDAPFNNSLFCWPGAVIVDQSSIDLDAANTGPGPSAIVGLTNGACTAMTTIGLNPLASAGGGTINPTDPSAWGLAGGRYVADWVAIDDGVAAVDSSGTIFILETQGAFGYTVVRSVVGLASFANNEHGITWDPEEEMLYTKITFAFSNEGRIAKWDKNLNQIWEFDMRIDGDAYSPVKIRYHHGVGDVWCVGRVTGLDNITKRVNKEVGGYTDQFNINLTTAFNDFKPFPGAPFAIGSLLSTGGAAKFPLGPGATPLAPTLAFIVTDLVEKSDTLGAADIDVTSLIPFTVRGYAVATRMTIRNALQQLLTAYFVDAVESDDKIKFVRRGNAAVVTVPPEDMSARRSESGPVDPIEESRTQENELPNQLDVRFINFQTDYKVGVTTTRRLIGASEQIRTMDVPIVFTPDEAKIVNDVIIHNAWFERTPKAFALGRKYLRLEPTDVINITTQDQGEIAVRINSMAVSLPQLIQIEANEDDVTIYDGYTFPGPLPLQSQPGLLDTPPVVLIILDTSQLQDSDNNTGLYVVAYAVGGPYDFAEVQQSNDNIVFGAGTVLPNEGDVGFAESQLTWEGSFD